jgi:hypothetical protein
MILANYIEKDTVDILKCSNWAMRALHYNLEEVIHQENFDKHTQDILNDFLERLDQNVYGAGCVVVDISDYFGSKDKQLPLSLFFALIQKTIEKIENKNTFDETYINLLEQFKAKIL